MEISDFPGISVARYCDGVTSAWTYGFADVAEKVQVSEDTVFHACSVSKFVTSILVMIMHQNNLLCLDRPVNTYLKGWKLTDPQNHLRDDVTLRHLLCHVSGVIDEEDSFYGFRGRDTYPSLIDILNGKCKYHAKEIHVEETPGSKFEYSDAGYCVIQKAIEDVTGIGFAENAEKHIFHPLGMRHSFFADREIVKKKRSEGLQLAAGYDGGHRPIEGKFVINPDMAAAGLWTTPKDLILLARDFLSSMEEKGRLLNKQLALSMTHAIFPQFGWVGMGLFFEGNGVIMSQGWGEDAQCKMVIDLNSKSVAVAMGNCDPEREQNQTIIGRLVEVKKG